MRIIGFSFTKISAEKHKDLSEELKFNTKINFLSVESIKSDFLKIKEEVIKLVFSYDVDYDPGFVKIEFKGEVLIAVEPKLAKELLKGWKDQQIPEEIKLIVFNLILRKSNAKALQLEEELGLPFHIPLPFLNKNSFKEDKESTK